MLIESGSHMPGVCAADFGLAAGSAMRIERAADALRPVLSSYRIFDSDGSLWSGAHNQLLPGWSTIRIALTADLFDVMVGNRHYSRIGSAMLFGPTSRSIPVTTYGGLSVVIDIGPLAFARLFTVSAESLCDRVTPLEQLLPRDWCDALVRLVSHTADGRDLKFVLDDFFGERMPPAHPQEATLIRIIALLVDEDTHDLSRVAAQVGIDNRLLLRLTKRFFGFPPKMLTMRTRFLRAMTAMLVDREETDLRATPFGYHDQSHFIRDANRFLGVTPRRFMALDLPYTRAALRARMLVMGAAISSLDRIEQNS